MIPAAIAITTNAMTPMTIPKIIPTLPFLVLGLTVVAGLFGSDVTNKKTKFTGNAIFLRCVSYGPNRLSRGFFLGYSEETAGHTLLKNNISSR